MTTRQAPTHSSATRISTRALHPRTIQSILLGSMSHRQAHAVRHALHPLLLRNAAEPVCARPRTEVVGGVAADGAEDGGVGRIIVRPFVYLLQAFGGVCLCPGQPVVVQQPLLPTRFPATASHSCVCLVFNLAIHRHKSELKCAFIRTRRSTLKLCKELSQLR